MKTSKKTSKSAAKTVLNTNPLKKISSVNGPGICAGMDASDVGSVSTQNPVR